MRFILSENTRAFFNLAAEDYMLHHWDADVLMLWRSRKAVVCGKHQNLCAEVNYGYCATHGIEMARRLSGGGTVYHDPGNINFTFIQNIPEGLEKAINFRRFLDPVIEALKSCGVHATYSGRNDLLLDGKKISGNAEHLYQKKKRVLHHGTLLFNADLTHLKHALHPDGIYTDKAVKSVRSEVANIQSAVPHLNIEDFLQNLCQYWLSEKHTNRYVFCENDVEIIESLVTTKYGTPAWNLHYSPKYQLQRTLHYAGKILHLKLYVTEGRIVQLEITDDSGQPIFPSSELGPFCALLDEKLSRLFAAWLQEKTGFEADPFILF